MAIRTVLGAATIGLVAMSLAHRSVEASEPAGLAALWDFDGTLEDVAGTSRDTLVPRSDGASAARPRFVASSDLPGASGQAIALGVAAEDVAYLTAPLSADLRLGPSYTLEAWILPTAVASWNRLALCWGHAPAYAWHLAIHDGTASLYHGQADGKLVSAERGAVRPGRWHHLVGVASVDAADPSRGTLTVYLDGRPTATAPFDGTIARPPAEGIGIGDSFGAPGAGTRFRGYLDRLAIWGRALAAEEVRARFEERAGVLRGLEAELRRLEAARREPTARRLAALGVEEIVFAERASGRDPSAHYYANFGYSCIDPGYWIHGADGGRLCKLDVRSGEVTALVDDPLGAVRDPQVRHDGKRILFSWRKGGTHRYHLHEIGVDGSDPRRITDGDQDDVEPAYLPDGGIVFCSTRCNRWIGCWLAQSATLYRCAADGGNLRPLSSGAFTENTPAVLPDGRILYTRWEYVNRDPVSFHHLWTMNRDGTGQMAYYGNMEPGGVFIDAKPIPGTDGVVMILSPGHGANEHAGHVALLSARGGPNDPTALKVLTPSGGFRDPYPLSRDLFVAAAGTRLVLVVPGGETEVLHDAGTEVHEPSPIVPRPREALTAPRSDPETATGTLILQDVRVGRNMAGVEPGRIKKLLVLEDLPKPANFHGGGSQPIGHGVTSTLKRILGTVPVEADGSAHFEVPALRSLYFAALDEDDLSVKQMRSFVTLQPGETASCVGCHEPRARTPAAGPRPVLRATSRPASRIEPIPDVPEIPEFPRDVQPVLDRHCVGCHGIERREGGVSLVGDRGPVFSIAYYELFLHWQVKDTGGDPADGTGRQPGNDRPYTTYSSASSLMRKIDGTHHDVSLSAAERRMVRLWIDAGAQYPGTYAAYGTGQIGGCWGNNEPIREMADAWPSTAAARAAVERRCETCHPRGQIPRHVTDRIPLDPWEDMLSWVRPLSRYSRHRLYDLTRPEASLILTATLAKEAGGRAAGAAGAPSPAPKEDRGRPPRPLVHPVVFADAGDPDYLAILEHIRAAAARLEEIRRFDMPGFRPNEHYIREMKRYGVLPASFDPARDPIDPYASDRDYWRSFWYHPVHSEVGRTDPKSPSGPDASGG